MKKIKKCSINKYNGNNIYKREGFFMLKNIKKIGICLIALFLVVGTAYTTLATEDGGDWLNELLQSQNGTIGENEPVENIPEGENKIVNDNENLNTNVEENENTSENLPEKTPHAGLEDYSGLVFVAIFAVSAIYAYKKIREYNV